MFEFEFTVEQLTQILHGHPQSAEWFAALGNNLPEYEVTSVNRVAAFLAQTCHESGNYAKLHENLNYRAESLIKTWPTRFNSSNAAAYAHQPEKIANKVYSSRNGNGDEASGDGWKFRGRGILQITGKANYTACSAALYEDPQYLLDNPELLEEDMDIAVSSSCWFWELNKLNALADVGDIKTMTKRINGGYIGLEERIAKFNQNLAILQG